MTHTSRNACKEVILRTVSDSRLKLKIFGPRKNEARETEKEKRQRERGDSPLAFVEVHEGIAAGYRNLVVFAGRFRAITPPLEW